MTNTTITSIQFKRGTKKALEDKLIGDKKPLYGEPIWETDTNRLKIGDGSKEYKDLPYLDSDNLILEGYYDSEYDVFWKDEGKKNFYPRCTNKIYKDLKDELYYYLKDNHYTLVLKLASSTEYGLSKLYSDKGENEDGSINQKVLTELLNTKCEIVSFDDDTLSLKVN